MPSLRIPMRRLRSPLRGDSEVFGSADRDVSRSAAAGAASCISSPAIQFKGSGLYITDYAKTGATRRQGEQGRPKSRQGRGRRRPTASPKAKTQSKESPAADFRLGSKKRQSRASTPGELRPATRRQRRRASSTTQARATESTASRRALADRATRDRPRTGRRGRAASARSRPPPSGTPSLLPVSWRTPLTSQA